jgi:hypothetical protein
MTRITNADQVLILLRAHLERADKTRRTARSTAVRAKRSALERVSEIAVDRQASEDDIRRALISGILTEEFGAELASDARFQDVVTNVLKMISEDSASSQVIDGALKQLMKGENSAR